MKYLEIGEERRKVSEIILGLMRIENMGEEEIYGLLGAAKEAQINALDTADIYADGVCEEKLGDVFRAHPDLRNDFFLQTKCGIHTQQFTWYDFSKEHIIKSVEGSLRRLRTDHIDCLLLHRPDALMEPEEVQEAFTTLHEQGKVLHFGVSNQNPMTIELLKTAVAFPLVANQLQMSCAFTPALNAGFHVNMEDDAAIMRTGSVLEYCRIHDVIVQAWSVMQYGFMEGAFISSDKYPELNNVLSRIAKEQEVTESAVAIAWILRYPAKMQAVIGTTLRGRILACAAAGDVHLSRKQWYEIYTAAGNRLP